MHSKSVNDSDQQSYRVEQQTSLRKTLILESNCHQSQQYSVGIPYNFATRQLDLGQPLYLIFKQIIPEDHQYQVFYYCDQSQYYVFGGMYPFQNYLLLGEEFAAQSVISVKIVRVNPPVIIATSQTISKKKRINDRTINQVLQKVSQWRNISKNKSITLQEAAKEVDLPKKTLDDYFYQVKQGQNYGFNFEINLNKKIGVLRKFVKENHKKKPEKPIKILEEFMGKTIEEEDDDQCDDMPEAEDSFHQSEQEQEQ